MKVAAIEKAEDRLSTAKENLSALEKSIDYPSSRRAWYGFLLSSNAIFSIFQQGTKKSTNCRGWFAKKTNQRQTDPLLSYLHQARNAEEHGIQSVTALDRQTAVFMMDGEPVASIDDIAGGSGTFRHLSKHPPDLSKVTELRIYPDRARLLSIKSRDVAFHPPSEHLGLRIEEATPIIVARLMIQYLESMIEEARQLEIER